MIELTQDLLKELFDYRNGNLYWKVSRGNKKSGDLAGRVTKNGYRKIGINGKTYLVHRLIFLYYHGYLSQFLDHIDGNKSNNYIDNLRPATREENGMNRKKHKSYNGESTLSIYKGVTWHKFAKKWQVQILVDGKHKYLGCFTSEMKAAKVYNRAATKYFGEFANLNEEI